MDSTKIDIEEEIARIEIPEIRRSRYRVNDQISDIKLWTLSGTDGRESTDEALAEDDFKSRLASYVRESEVNKATGWPTFSLFTAEGTPTLIYSQLGDREQEPEYTYEGKRAYGFLDGLFTESMHIRGVNCAAARSVHACYRGDGFITIVVSLGRNLRCVFCVMKIYFTPHLRTVSFLSCKSPADLAEIRRMCLAEKELLNSNPMALLSIVYDHRVRSWEAWERDLFATINEIEIAQGMAPEGWELHPPSRARIDELGDPTVLSRRLAQINSQLCHGRCNASQGVRYPSFCLEAIATLEREARETNKLFVLKRRANLEDRIRATESLCRAVLERFDDLGERLRGVISIIHNAIALKEMRISRIIANNSLDATQRAAVDGSITKMIAVMGLVFLPQNSTSSLWQTGIFAIQGSANGIVYTLVTFALTIFVMVGGWFYLRSVGRLNALYRREIGADPAMA